MSEVEQTVPNMDHGVDGANEGQTEQALLDAVLSQTEFLSDEDLDAAGVPLPDEEVPEVDPEVSEEYDEVEPEAEDTSVDDENEEVVDEEETVEDGDEGSPNPDAEVFELEDLDLDAQVRVKVDGEEYFIPFGDMIKGYQTDSSLSKKGRELGEARKAFEQEVVQAQEQLGAITQAATTMLYGQEQEYSKAYHEANRKLEEAVEKGETWELDDLKEARKAAQTNYWDARKQRETAEQQATAMKQHQAQREMEEKLVHFNAQIGNYLPDFTPEVADELREFVLENGVSEQVVNTVVDPALVGMLYELKNLRGAATKGAEKRKAVATKKGVPTKKATSNKKKKQTQEQMVKARAHREDASPDDIQAYARLLASRTLGE